MGNPIYVLAGLLIAGAYPLGMEPLEFARRPVLAWALPSSFLLYALLCRVALAGSSSPIARLGLRVAALGFYAVLIFVFHLPLGVWRLGLENQATASVLLTLAPLLGYYGLLAVVEERRSRRGALGFAFRSFLGLSLLPLVAMLLLVELFERIEPLRRIAFLYPAVHWLVAFSLLPMVMVVLPPILRRLLDARPLEAGPLRERLERLCAAAGFRAGELLVVPTGRSRLSNAFVVGLASRWRYVFFTDAILHGMSPAELECVLAHELTHSQKRHIPCYLVGAAAFAMLSALGHEMLDSAGAPAAMILLFGTASTALYWIVGFGFLSRRFETEADLVAARLAPPAEGGLAPYGAARSMALALDRVAVLNGVPISAPSWRHFTIERRIQILLRAERDPAYGAAFERVSRRLRTAALVLLAAGIGAGVALFDLQWERGPENRKLYDAIEAVRRGRAALEAGRPREAQVALRQGIEGGADDAETWTLLADAELDLGLPDAARASEQKARERDVVDPRLRIRLGR